MSKVEEVLLTSAWNKDADGQYTKLYSCPVTDPELIKTYNQLVTWATECELTWACGRSLDEKALVVTFIATAAQYKQYILPEIKFPTSIPIDTSMQPLGIKIEEQWVKES